jgi:hypothetical protein
MNQYASDTGRVGSTREVDCWENEGGADRAPHEEDSDQTKFAESREHRQAAKPAQSITKGDQWATSGIGTKRTNTPCR